VVSTYNSSVSSIAFPDASFVDDFVQIKQHRSTLEQEFSVNNINALSGARDARINNYSNLYLTNKDRLTNFIQLSTLSQSPISTLTSRLYFNRPEPLEPASVYIFSTNSISATDEQKQVGLKTYNDLNGFIDNFYFEIEMLNSRYLRIKHNNGKKDYFLNYLPDTNGVVFYQYTSDGEDITTERNDVFRYTIDIDGFLQVYKFANNKLNILTLSGNTIAFAVMIDGGLNRSQDNLINIDYSLNSSKVSLNNSFINYKAQKLNSLKIDTTKSLFNDVGQYVFQTNYNTISTNNVLLNYFTADTYRSEFNFIKRGSNMSIDSSGTSSYNYRTYNSFHTGAEQERGTEKINLNYTFYDKDIFIENEADTHFRAPSAIYPYSKLNINDTVFTQNGSFAGPSPLLADKIYAKRNIPGVYENGRFLCTWLSAGSLGDKGIWVDRYYYPDIITKSEALSSVPKYTPSFLDSVDNTALNVTSAILAREKFFDKKSDLTIIPNIQLKYERIGIDNIADIISTQAPLVSSFTDYYSSRILRGRTENSCVPYDSNSLYYNGSIFSKLSVYEKINESKAFTISFDAYIDPSKQYGFQILGNNTNQGFGVFQDQTVTPFLHVVSGNMLYIYNSNFGLVNKVSFQTNIKDIYKRAAMDDFTVASSGNLLYTVNPQGNKIRLECNSSITDYQGSHQEDGEISFLSSSGNVHKLDVNTLEATPISAAELDVYRGEFSIYENIIEVDGTVYKLPGQNLRWENNETIFYTVSNYVVKHNLRSQPQAFLKSSTPITDININDNIIYIATENLLYEYNTNGIFQLSSNFDTLEGDGLLSPLSGGSIISIDFVNEYINGENVQYPIYLCADTDNNLYLSKGIVDTKLEGVVKTSNTYNIPITNYNNINRLYDSSSIDFKLTLQNFLNREDKLTQTISFDTSTIDTGFYTFTYRFDSLQGNTTLYINGELYENMSLPAGKYQIQDIFNDELYIGTAGFQSGLDLSTYLKQPRYYYINDLELKNINIFDKAVDTNTIYALYLQGKQIDDLVLSIPYSQRNNKTQIDRFFKLGRYNSSKNIDVVVKNLNITDDDIKSQIRTNILNESKDILPIGVKINEIQFKDYS